MPELPEVEIVARRLDTALAGAGVESALAPGMNVMKTFEPPLEALVGREVSGVRRVGKMPVVEFGDLALLIHLMSAGRLRRLRQTGLAERPRLAGAGPARGRPRAAAARVRDQAAGLGEAAAGRRGRRGRDGRDARPRSLAPSPLEEFAAAIDQPRHLHPLLRHQKDIAGIGRSWVDEILWEARLSPFKKGSELDAEEVERLHAALHVLGDAIDHYEETIGAEVPDKVPMPLQVHKREGEPCPRCGTTIEAVFFSEHQTNYCPEEQTGGRVLKDRRLSQLLK